MKGNSICIMGILQEKWMKKGQKNIFKEITAENFPNLRRVMGIQTHEAQTTQNKLSQNRIAPRYVLINLSKVKDK